jgi:RND family efflux transporter MFP subunit
MPLDKQALEALKMDRDRIQDAAQRRAMPYVLVAGLASVLLLGAAAWWLLRSEPVTVEVAVAQLAEGGERRQAATVLNASGYVVARRVATVASRVTGQITEVRIEEGMHVEEGELLARLDDSIARAELALAESRVETARRQAEEVRVRLEEARRTLERTRALRERDLASESALDAARAEVAALEARLTVALGEAVTAERMLALSQRNVDETLIRAPFAGVVVSKNAQPGETISPMSAGGFTRTGIATIVDMESLEIEVDVNEAFINRVQADQPVRAVLDAYPDWSIPARVISIVPTADRQRATVRVRVGFEALDPRILPEMGVQVWFLEAAPQERQENGGRMAVLIPERALRGAQGGEYLYVVHQGRVQRRMVQVGNRQGGQIEILAGVGGGEQVILNAAGELEQGSPVIIRQRNGS